MKAFDAARRRALPAVVGLALLLGAVGAAGLALQLAMAPPAAADYAGSWTPTYNQDFPDPTVMSYSGTLYAYSTETVAANTPGATSSDPAAWSTVNGDVFPTLPSFAGPGSTWAPSVEQAANGEFVMYYTARNPIGADQCIGEATSTSPTGPFVDSNPGFVVCQEGLGGSIDPQIFQFPGGAELLWKTDGNSNKQDSHIWAESLDADLQLTGAVPSLLLSDDELWQAGIIEGPDMVDVNGTFELFYGANRYATSKYSIGYATCAGPAGPCVDHAQPALATQPGAQGPGGPALFDYDGQLLMAFAAWPGAIGYAQGGYRAMYVASVTFDNTGTPQFAPYNAGPDGYALAGAGGDVFSFGNAANAGTLSDPNAPVVGMAMTPDGQGYWQVAADGGVFSFGDAGFRGSLGALILNKPIVGMAADPATGGYWLVAADGGVFAFDAPYLGSMGGQPLNQPVVGMAATADGQGYRLVTRDGGVFSFGSATFDGSMGAVALNRPVVGMADDGATGGYWLVASDGGIFSFDAPYQGSLGGIALDKPVVGMAAHPSSGGYWLVASDGGIFSFAAPFLGSVGGQRLARPIVGIAAAG